MIIHVSKSISNWHDKIIKRYKAEEYKFWKHLWEPVVFFGLYRPKDFLLFFLHRGAKTVHWQGSDILAAGWHYRWLSRIRAKHICENEVEQGVLRLMLQQEVEVRPTFLGDTEEYKITYKHSDNPHVWMNINWMAELESGYNLIFEIANVLPEVTFHIYGKCEEPIRWPNIIYHGYVKEKTFNEEIKNYQAGLRLHEFDGFSEVIAKSVLNGQYPISRIRYPHIDTYKDEQELIALLRDLKNKKKPNYKAREYYVNAFK